ncbi:hypothetical protein BDP27DRAFT_1427721 [Rhodocollybia butyracea]|uniref:Uncharacterized protein n=1 Tax=Rhodocollybia butyracea TaxID=206335 RepID=A0A9P5PCH9_9AGAR|nr:hypothetical protein BDP27DRAFT_1427721 [Rhodocollybia butyracea]
MRLILLIYSCLLGLFLAVGARPVSSPPDPDSKQEPFDLGSELTKWVALPAIKEKIGRAWKLKGGWEGWAQVELAIFLEDTLGKDFGVTREDLVYEGTKQQSDIKVLQKSTNELTILELKCKSLNNRHVAVQNGNVFLGVSKQLKSRFNTPVIQVVIQQLDPCSESHPESLWLTVPNKKNFGSEVGKDMQKINNPIKSAYNTKTLKSTIWSVAIGGIEGTGKDLEDKMEKPIEFETTDNRKMGIWRAKVVVKDKKGTSTGSAPNKAATGVAEPSQSPKQAQTIEHHDAAPAGKNNNHDKDATAESWQKALTTEHPAKENKGAAQPTSHPQTPPSDQKEPPYTPPGAPVKPAAEWPKMMPPKDHIQRPPNLPSDQLPLALIHHLVPVTEPRAPILGGEPLHSHRLSKISNLPTLEPGLPLDHNNIVHRP